MVPRGFSLEMYSMYSFVTCPCVDPCDRRNDRNLLLSRGNTRLSPPTTVPLQGEWHVWIVLVERKRVGEECLASRSTRFTRKAAFDSRLMGDIFELPYAMRFVVHSVNTRSPEARSLCFAGWTNHQGWRRLFRSSLVVSRVPDLEKSAMGSE